MSKYIDADLLRKEIERRRLHFNKEAEKYQALNNGYSQNCYGARDALRDLENFIDTLSEEPDKSLEKELKKWRHEHFRGERDGHYSGEYLERNSQLEIARHFYELGKNSKSYGQDREAITVKRPLLKVALLYVGTV